MRVGLHTDGDLRGSGGVLFVANVVEHFGLDPEAVSRAVLRKAVVGPEPVLTKPDGFIDPRLDSELAKVEHDYLQLLRGLKEELRGSVRAFGPSQVADLGQRIRAAHAAFAAYHIGRDALSRHDRALADSVRGLPMGDARDFIEFAFSVGVAGAKKEDEHLVKAWGIFKRVLSWVRRRAARAITGLGNRLGSNFETLAIDTEHQTREDLAERITGEVAAAVHGRETVKQLASRIGHETQDWSRDLLRIARTEMQQAHQQGWAAHFKATTGDASRVAKRLDPEACKDCRRLYLEPDGKPRIFLLSDLQANGTNVGKKRDQWMAVVGGIHPHCACSLIRVPPGFGFDDEGRMVPMGMGV